jgi:hypothetical protein
MSGKKLKQDAVMALWFCEIVAREQLFRIEGKATSFVKNEFATRGDMNSRFVINLDDFANA